MGGNSEAILSHTTNQLHFYKQLLQNFTLDRNIMVHKKLFLAETPHQFKLKLSPQPQITTLLTRGGGGGVDERRCTTNAESLDHSKCRSA